MITAEMCGTPAPTPAADNIAAQFGDEIGSVLDQLRVESHNLLRRPNLLRRKVRRLQFLDRALHNHIWSGNIVCPGKAQGPRRNVGTHGRKRISSSPAARD